MTSPVQAVQQGVLMIRGDNLALVGELDEEIDGVIDYEQIRVGPLPPMIH
jgi:U6 snRNA-associated Sm-like protein LSm8